MGVISDHFKQQLDEMLKRHEESRKKTDALIEQTHELLKQLEELELDEDL